MNLSELKNGQKGVIRRVRGTGPFRKRITEMGFVRGKTVTVIKNAPMRDPIEYKILDYNISLRRKEAALIDVDIPEHAAPVCVEEELSELNGRPFRLRQRRGRRRRDMRISVPEIAAVHPPRQSEVPLIRVALVGNPNSGKTTIFNRLSGLQERVGNYGGVTIEAKEARFIRSGHIFHVTDLPGTYSITAYSPEELFVRKHIIENSPDVIVNIIDAANLERNLYLTAQLIEMGLKVVVALNMYDELEKKNDFFDYETLGKLLGIPFIPTIGHADVGFDALFEAIIAVHQNRNEITRTININYGSDMEKAITAIQNALADSGLPESAGPPRYSAVKLLEKDGAMEEHFTRLGPAGCNLAALVRKQIEELESALKEDTETFLADARYGFIAGALRETYRPAARPAMTASEKIDRILTHQIFGLPIFFLFMLITFQFTFSVGQYPMDWIEAGIGLLSEFVTSWMQPGLLRELIVDGIIAGVGGVVIFVPSILILFFMISLMEDTGYMARAAFIMDRLMHAIGLHGKSFIPLLMGFGCNVPAIMATRTLESRKDRVLTMLIIPFMSCSARLPIYLLFIGAFFPEHAATVLFGLYFTGIAVAVCSAMAMKKTLFRKAEVPFVMELPPYRAPLVRNTLRHMWERGKEYLKKVGGIVLIAAILIWALSRFPADIHIVKNFDEMIVAAQEHYSLASDVVIRSAAGEHARSPVDSRATEQQRLERSFIGVIGKAAEPVMAPLGFDWKMGVSLITGLAAKEIAVSTLGILYHAGGDKDRSLVVTIREQRHESGPLAGERIFDSLTALGYMVFVLLYVPCVATLVTMRRETGSLKWPLFSAIFSISLAWLAAFIIHNLGSLLR
ncbi:MAG: ferrous iron transport protein B [Spirochaetes bacterium]|nr:ferrous iron transport protein B [Spirochaetota bacterium]